MVWSALPLWFCWLQPKKLFFQDGFAYCLQHFLMGTAHWWGIHFCFSFILTALLCITLLGTPYRDSSPATHCLATQVSLWSLSGSHHNHVTLTFCTPTPSPSHEYIKAYSWHRLHLGLLAGAVEFLAELREILRHSWALRAPQGSFLKLSFPGRF
jgi:hypothetical protein